MTKKAFDWTRDDDHDQLRETFLNLRVARIKYDAENSTSWEEEVRCLVEEAYDLDELTVAELRFLVREEHSLL